MAVRLRFEGIRCFSEPQDAIVRPLTLLVGENSSGKSTFLALCQIACRITNGFDQVFPFNNPPFLLGAYDQVASYRGGRAGRAKSFSIAISLDSEARTGSIETEFMSKDGQPSLSMWRLTVGSLIWLVTAYGGRERASLFVESPRGRHEVAEIRPWMTFEPLNEPLELWARTEFEFLAALFSESDWDTLLNLA
ncbi:hypothetical protein SBA6_460001 [Candidatus Sulfopaludibacter sp. SbA6]|nr:hypothetical protein SBA6_460001 [Candidatus Sulfopaludibacter sp. SbA6]